MIIDKIENLDKYIGTHPRFAAAIPFVKELIANGMPACGRYDMPNCDKESAVYANAMTYTTNPLSEKTQMEAHRTYIDIQIMMGGEEVMYVPGIGEHPVTKEYDKNADFELMAMDAELATKINAKAGTFVVFFAGELHAPSVALNGKPCEVSKIVAKIMA